jgi:hypothetical protein
MWIIFIGGFLFFWLIGSIFLKENGIFLPIGIIAFGFIAAFLWFMFEVLTHI